MAKAKAVGAADEVVIQDQVTGEPLPEAVPPQSNGDAPKKGRRPAKSFWLGNISVSVFVNAGETRTGNQRAFHSVVLQRRYWNETKQEWDWSPSLTLGDIPTAMKALEIAFNYVQQREQPY